VRWRRGCPATARAGSGLSGPCRILPGSAFAGGDYLAELMRPVRIHSMPRDRDKNVILSRSICVAHSMRVPAALGARTYCAWRAACDIDGADMLIYGAARL
jgi:hypothetical protein